MKFILLVRASVPWDQLTISNYKEKGGFFAGSWMEVVDKSIERWDKVFQLSLFEYRHRVSQIAKTNWENIDGLHDIIYSDGTQSKTIKIINQIKKQKDSIIIPVDDDDWFAPNIIKELLPHTHRPIIHWNQAIYDPYDPFKGSYQVRNSRAYQFYTNNFAFNSFIYDFGTRYDKIEMSLNHLYFDRNITDEKFAPLRCNWITINKNLSIANRTMASLSKLNKMLRHKSIKSKINRHAFLEDNLDNTQKLLQQVPWSVRYIELVEQLYLDLKGSKKWNR
jgi:hypothetical protein